MRATGRATATEDEAFDLAHALRQAGITDVDASALRRGEYSSDASNYRVVPKVVVFPRDPDEVAGVIEIARATRTPVTARGGGTSLAGNAVGPGIVMDFSKHLTRIELVDPQERIAIVEPGVVLGSLQRAAAPYGLRFGPDPSTWSRCTIGGMIGNNSCGHRALAFGRTADNVEELAVIDGTGRRFVAGRGWDAVGGLGQLITANLDIIRTELGGFRRQISGYSLEHLLPENGRNLARSLVGTEGTCAVVLRATLRLVDSPRWPVLVVLGYPDMPSAADAVPALLPHHPVAIEGLDRRIVETVRRARGAAAVPELPSGGGWLLVEVDGVDTADAVERANQLARDAGTAAWRVLADGPEARATWRIREDGAGLSGRTVDGRPTWPGFEDAAVPAAHLGAYLRDFDALLDRHGLTGAPYGHFGDGCVHIRLDIPLEKDGSALRAFMTEAAQVVARYGGSLSGEHGDGRARSELLPYMYSARMIDLFGQFKTLFDPNNILNPGVIVDPAPLEQDLRRPCVPPVVRSGGFAFVDDDGDLTKAVHRCVGLGKCRADNTPAGGFMCPSFVATRDETHTTRGRARVLQEMINGSLIPRDFRCAEVRDALELCLSCKACARDCPAGVDMATYKSEVLYRAYRGRLRPLTHYTLGWVPLWARLGSRVPGLVNALLSVRPVERVALRVGGMDARRSMPRLARTPFRVWWRRRRARAVLSGKRRVLLWTDTFSDAFAPSVATAAVALLESAGYEVLVPRQQVCCQLPAITTGQLDRARRALSGLVETLHPYVAAGIPVLGLEPSCIAAVRSDLGELLPDDPKARDVAHHLYTLAELLTAPPPLGPGNDWQRPDLRQISVVAQPHCHHHSVMGYEADLKLLRELGASVTLLSGCCGLAGNFGMERGHYDISVKIAENALLPSLRAASPDTILVADGFSCRTQALQLAGVQGVHLAELLASSAGLIAAG